MTGGIHSFAVKSAVAVVQPPVLTGKQRRFLRALAHPLKPVVQIGVSGPTVGVIGAIVAALQTHELIKVKVSPDCIMPESELVAAIQHGAGAAIAQTIGRIWVLYRPRAEKPAIRLPRDRARSEAEGLSRNG